MNRRAFGKGEGRGPFMGESGEKYTIVYALIVTELAIVSVQMFRLVINKLFE
jgi:hypothetical protein